MDSYVSFLNELKGTIESFVGAAEAGTEGRGSKTKALEARKLSMKLTNDLKDFRKVSIENDKNK